MKKVKSFFRGKESGMVGKVVSVILLIVVLGAIVPALWPVMQDTDTDIQALNATGSTSTAFLQTVWPIVLLVIGIGVAAGLIFYALRRFGVLGAR